jgi:hypothetical protein
MKNSTSGGTSADADALSQAKNQFSFLNRNLVAWVERQLNVECDASERSDAQFRIRAFENLRDLNESQFLQAADLGSVHGDNRQ